MIKSKMKWHIRMALCCFCLAAALLGVCATADSVLYSAQSTAMSAARASISTAAAIALAVQALATPLAVRLAERVPLRGLVACGGIFASGALAGLGYVRTIPGLYVLFFLRGLGCACFSAPIITAVVATWFVHRRGLVTGLVMSASGVAGALMSPVLAACVQALGLSGARLIQAAAVLVLTVPGSLLFLHAAPEEIGQKPYITERLEQEEHHAEGPGLQGHSFLLGILFAFSVAATALNQFILHFSGYAESLGWSTAVGAVMVSAAMVGNIASKTGMGLLCDRLGAVRANLVMLAVGGLGLLGLFTEPNTKILLYLSGAFYGMIYSLQTVGLPQLTQQLAKKGEYARAYAWVCAVSGSLGAASVSLWGVLYERTGSYRAALWLCAGLLILAAMLLLGIGKALHSRKKAKAARIV